jgi:hypothetical protein
MHNARRKDVAQHHVYPTAWTFATPPPTLILVLPVRKDLGAELGKPGFLHFHEIVDVDASHSVASLADQHRSLLGRSHVRYAASLALAIAVAAGLSLLFRHRTATDLMVQVSQMSSAAVLLPLVAGGTGALNLVQSERNSLVSGAAVGMLVAASLAPQPA